MKSLKKKKKGEWLSTETCTEANEMCNKLEGTKKGILLTSKPCWKTKTKGIYMFL